MIFTAACLSIWLLLKQYSTSPSIKTRLTLVIVIISVLTVLPWQKSRQCPDLTLLWVQTVERWMKQSSYLTREDWNLKRTFKMLNANSYFFLHEFTYLQQCGNSVQKPQSEWCRVLAHLKNKPGCVRDLFPSILFLKGGDDSQSKQSKTWLTSHRQGFFFCLAYNHHVTFSDCSCRKK